MSKLIIPYVTTNNSKFEEITNFLNTGAKLPFEVVQDSLEVPEIQSEDQKEITTFKALEAWKILKRPLLVEDAGIFFDKYDNFPGTFSKWIFKSLGFEGVCKLYQPGDSAHFQLTLCYLESPDSIHFFTGIGRGTLIAPKPGHNPNLPFSVLFVPNGHKKTYHELAQAKEHGPVSFRTKALQAFIEWYATAHKAE